MFSARSGLYARAEIAISYLPSVILLNTVVKSSGTMRHSTPSSFAMYLASSISAPTYCSSPLLRRINELIRRKIRLCRHRNISSLQDLVQAIILLLRLSAASPVPTARIRHSVMAIHRLPNLFLMSPSSILHLRYFSSLMR